MIPISRRALPLLAAAGGRASAGPALAPHGWGSHNADRPLELTGTIEAMSYEWPPR
jgi:hypothetical protein